MYMLDVFIKVCIFAIAIILLSGIIERLTNTETSDNITAKIADDKLIIGNFELTSKSYGSPASEGTLNYWKNMPKNWLFDRNSDVTNIKSNTGNESGLSLIKTRSIDPEYYHDPQGYEGKHLGKNPYVTDLMPPVVNIDPISTANNRNIPGLTYTGGLDIPNLQRLLNIHSP